MSDKSHKLALVGATGLVGREVLSVLGGLEEDFDLKLLASDRSQGESLEYKNAEIKVGKLSAESLKDVDFAIFTAGGGISREFVPVAAKAGVVCIDNSSVFRMDKDVPLVVPEVNPDALSNADKRNIVANPNCSTIQLVAVLAPIHKKVKIKRVVVSTYQSVSGAGKRAIDELSEQVVSLFNNREFQPNRFPHQIAFNCIPQIDIFTDNGYTKEEMKIVNETRKILGAPDLAITATAVRVPVFSCHSESVNIEMQEKMDAGEVLGILKKAPGVEVIDDPGKMSYPLPVSLAGSDHVYVGRIRNDESRPNSINLWIVADNLRKGAALNAVQIIQRLIKDYF